MAQSWVDEHGFCGMYDFFLYFPAKATSRLNSFGYAFVNFRELAQAKRFHQDLHQTSVDSGEPGGESVRLSIAVAKVQGFAENYSRFRHHLEGNTPTRCLPYFATDSVAALGDTEVGEVPPTSQTSLGTSLPGGPASPASPGAPAFNGVFTTVVVRNLPAAVDTPEIAQGWFDAAGYTGQYDFFLYFPAKRPRSGQPFAPQSMAYAFINFKEADSAGACLRSLSSLRVPESEAMLNVVAAKVQGLEACRSHFSTLADSGRCTPWVAGEGNAAAPQMGAGVSAEGMRNFQ